jgi:cellulose synthase (UDP-forming)
MPTIINIPSRKTQSIPSSTVISLSPKKPQTFIEIGNVRVSNPTSQNILAEKMFESRNFQNTPQYQEPAPIIYSKKLTPTSQKKYSYIVENPWSIRLSNLFALVAYSFVAFGFWQFLNITPWYALTFGPIIALVLYTNSTTYFTNMFYPTFSIKKHEEFIEHFWKHNPEPVVDIFLPVAGEDTAILQKTWEAVNKIDYENKTIYVLDDGGSTEVSQLATKFGFTYISRPNRGEWKKSGNIQYGLDASRGEFIFILDADFAPIPESLNETIPYIVQNNSISILQTPQFFETSKEIHKKSPIQYGAGSIVEEFYRIMLPSRVMFGSGKCVGTSAVYRRKAIMESGGMPKVDGSEDIRIGLQTYREGYHVHYLPLVISQGICPETIQAYFKQQSRWADGSVATVFSDLYKNNKLDLWAKYNYFNTFLYYLTEAITPFLSLQILALMYFNTDSIKVSWIVPFIPYLIYVYIIKPRNTLNKYRYGTMITGLTNMVAYADAIIRLVLKRSQKWQVAGAKKTSLSKEFFVATSFSALFTAIYVMLLGFVLYSRPELFSNWETWIVLVLSMRRVYDFGVYCLEGFKSIEQNLRLDSASGIRNGFGAFVYRISQGILVISILGTTGIIGYQIFSAYPKVAPKFTSSFQRVQKLFS